MPGRGRPFQKGNKANPTGRPKVAAEVQELARKHGPEAIARLRELMDSGDGRTAVAACNSMLDRAYGKPVQQVTGADGGPLKIDLGAEAALIETLRRLAAAK